MLKKLHIALIISILFIGISSINTYAAETVYTDDTFVSPSGNLPLDYVTFETSSGNKSTIAIYCGFPLDESYYNTAWKDGNVIRVNFKKNNGFDYSYRVWNYDARLNTWHSNESKIIYTGDNGLTQSMDGQIIYSTFDLYDLDGNLFFQPTPVEVPILETIMAMTPTIAEKIVETLRILVPFGVGLLALWIGLLLLPKILYKFL